MELLKSFVRLQLEGSKSVLLGHSSPHNNFNIIVLYCPAIPPPPYACAPVTVILHAEHSHSAC